MVESYWENILFTLDWIIVFTVCRDVVSCADYSSTDHDGPYIYLILYRCNENCENVGTSNREQWSCLSDVSVHAPEVTSNKCSFLIPKHEVGWVRGKGVHFKSPKYMRDRVKMIKAELTNLEQAMTVVSCLPG